MENTRLERFEKNFALGDIRILPQTQLTVGIASYVLTRTDRQHPNTGAIDEVDDLKSVSFPGILFKKGDWIR